MRKILLSILFVFIISTFVACFAALPITTSGVTETSKPGDSAADDPEDIDTPTEDPEPVGTPHPTFVVGQSSPDSPFHAKVKAAIAAQVASDLGIKAADGQIPGYFAYNLPADLELSGLDIDPEDFEEGVVVYRAGSVSPEYILVIKAKDRDNAEKILQALLPVRNAQLTKWKEISPDGYNMIYYSQPRLGAKNCAFFISYPYASAMQKAIEKVI